MLLDIVRQFGDQIDNNRDIKDIFDALMSEIIELDDEIILDQEGRTPGEDGVFGEAIDCLACILDLLIKSRPELTPQQLQFEVENYLFQKCSKWLSKHRNGKYES